MLIYCVFLLVTDCTFAYIFFSRYVLQIKVKPTGKRKLDYEKHFVPSNVPLVLPQAHPSRLVIPKTI
jgi:hypothetical protein